MGKLRKTFSANLKLLREQRNLTQEELAEKLKTSARYIQSLESKNPPNVKIDTIESLAKALKVSPKKFF